MAWEEYKGNTWNEFFETQTNEEKVWDILSSERQIDKDLKEQFLRISVIISNNEDIIDKDNTDFLKILNWLNDNEKNQFINTFNTFDNEDLGDELEDWFPTIEGIQSLWIVANKLNNIREITEVDSIDNKELSIGNKEKAKDNFNNLFWNWNLDLSSLDWKIEELINNLVEVDINDEKFDYVKKELFDYLKQWDNLNQLLTLIAEHSPESFDQFTEFVKANDTNLEFTKKIAKFKAENFALFSVEPVEWSIQNSYSYVISSLPETRKEWDKLISEVGDDMQAVVDTSTNPPSRVITNWNYELKSEPFLGPLMNPSIEYESTVSWLKKEKSNLIKQWNIIFNEIKELEWKIVSIDEQLESVKAELWEDSKMYKQLLDDKIEVKKSLDNNRIILTQKKERILFLESEIKTAKNKYIKQVQDSQKAYAEWLKERDERKKETLKFLDSIGFDEINQSATNQIIDTINNGSDKATFGFRNKINLANWNLWINLDGDINSFWIKEKKFFAEFVNILISWAKWEPIDIDSMTLWVPRFIDKNWKEVIDKDAYIKKEMWSNHFSTIQANIKKFKEWKDK